MLIRLSSNRVCVETMFSAMRAWFAVVLVLAIATPHVKATPTLSTTDFFSRDNQLARTGFVNPNCQPSANVYTFRVHNGISLPVQYTVTLDCEDQRASNALSVGTLASSSTTDVLSISPASGTISSQQCTLQLLGPDVFGDTTSTRVYAKVRHVCGTDVTASDADEACGYFECLVNKHSFYRNGLFWYILYGALVVLASIFLVIIWTSKRSRANSQRLNYTDVAPTNEMIDSIVRSTRHDELQGESAAETKKLLDRLAMEGSRSMKGGASASETTHIDGQWSTIRNRFDHKLHGGSGFKVVSKHGMDDLPVHRFVGTPRVHHLEALADIYPDEVNLICDRVEERCAHMTPDYMLSVRQAIHDHQRLQRATAGSDSHLYGHTSGGACVTGRQFVGFSDTIDEQPVVLHDDGPFEAHDAFSSYPHGGDAFDDSSPRISLFESDGHVRGGHSFGHAVEPLMEDRVSIPYPE